jgi:hypothetical protein
MLDERPNIMSLQFPRFGALVGNNDGIQRRGEPNIPCMAAS